MDSLIPGDAVYSQGWGVEGWEKTEPGGWSLSRYQLRSQSLDREIWNLALSLLICIRIGTGIG